MPMLRERGEDITRTRCGHDDTLSVSSHEAKMIFDESYDMRCCALTPAMPLPLLRSMPCHICATVVRLRVCYMFARADVPRGRGQMRGCLSSL